MIAQILELPAAAWPTMGLAIIVVFFLTFWKMSNDSNEDNTLMRGGVGVVCAILALILTLRLITS